MKMTEALKRWLVDNCCVEKDVEDDKFREAAGDALVKDTLSPEKYAELTADPKAGEANEFAAKLDAIADGLKGLVALQQPKKDPDKETDEAAKKAADEKAAADKAAAEKAATEKKAAEKGAGTDGKADWQEAVKASLSGEGTNHRVKGAWEGYSDTKSAALYPTKDKHGRTHPKAGQQLMSRDEGSGYPIDNPSELDKAVIGAWCQWKCITRLRGGSRKAGWDALPQHSKELVQYAVHEMNWAGSSRLDSDFADIDNRKLSEMERKDLLDDAVGFSGGLEAAPIVFDAAVIEAPLLYGELYPLVNVVTIPRGRRIEGVSILRVTGGWGGVDATPITEFITTNYVANFDTTIWRWEGAVLIGKDFLADTPINFGQIITRQYGEALLQDLDNAIATGAGTQPLGIVSTAGAGTAWLGATNLGNYETLRFGIPKQEHQGGMLKSAVFCGTEQSYQRSKSIAVAAADNRRVFAYDSTTTGNYDDYSIMARAYKINASMTNARVFYAIMKRYRLYLRHGLELRTTEDGRTLVRRNEIMISCTARYGGQLERAAAAVFVADAPA